MSITVKRKRISKKRKEAWRKTDIQDVDDFLEEQRQQERIGTLTDKTDSELFTIDATPHKAQEVPLTERQKRKLNAKKPMRSHAELENTSKVQDPIVKRNHVKLKKSGRIIEEEVRNPTKPRHFQANKDRERYYEQLEKKLKSKSEHPMKAAKDLWDDIDFRDEIPGLKDEKGWISRDLALHVTKNVGKPVIKTHASLRHRTTKAKNFEPPHPGTSYNPSPESHLDLINKVVGVEEKIIKENKHLKRVTTHMFKKVTPEEHIERYLKEMKGDEEDDNESKVDTSVTGKKAGNLKKKKSKQPDTGEDAGKENSDLQDDAPYQSVNPPVENKKRSKQAKRNELKQKELQDKKQKEKQLKKQIADLNRIKSIKAEVLADEEKLNALKKRRKKVALQKKFQPKRLGRLKYVDPDIDVNMPEDISGSIRNVKPESSLLVDRFKNFQKRNILPVSAATGKQKSKKIKRFPRSSHKEPGVSHQMLRDKRKAAAKSEGKPDASFIKVN